jgi:hypothetical protein
MRGLSSRSHLALDSPAGIPERGTHAADRAHGRSRTQSRSCRSCCALWFRRPSAWPFSCHPTTQSIRPSSRQSKTRLGALTSRFCRQWLDRLRTSKRHLGRWLNRKPGRSLCSAVLHLALGAQRSKLLELTAKAKLPAIHRTRNWVDEGGLLSFGANNPKRWSLAATYVDKILKRR